MKALFVWLFIATGLSYILIGLPLARGKVKPNRTYGFRTPKTLANEDLWYAANRTSGTGFIVSGVLTLIVAAIFRESDWIVYATILGVTSVIGVVTSVVVAWYKDLRNK